MAISSGNSSGPRKNDVPNIVGDAQSAADAKLTAAEFDKRKCFQYRFK
jgi:beta-lactam-binding protein with PASTA domain